jgi:rod shape-determining protein MreC
MNVSSGASINKKKKILPRILIGFGILFLFIFILNIFSPQIKNYFFVFSLPVQETFFVAGETCSDFLGSFAKSGFYAKENENLKSENKRLLAEIASLQAITTGNQAQSQVSSACQNKGFSLIMAGVSGLEGQDIISINKGSVDGVAEGMPVIDQKNVLYGKIFKVYKNFSEVMLISNKNSVINVKIMQDREIDSAVAATSGKDWQTAEKTEIDGVIKGKNQLGVFLDLVPIDSTIKQGDVLLTSALEGTFPKDLLVGKITKVIKNEQDPHQQAQIKPFFNVSADNLFVITNYKQGK